MSTNGADYNVFGYDPEGRVASLAAIFYGPAWQPVNHDHLPTFVDGVVAPPRYGAPAPEQLPSLPANFVALLPPCYFGAPDPPYRLGPDTFNRDNFAAILLRHSQDRPPLEESLATQYRRRILEGLPVGEVKHGVFWVPVYHVPGPQQTRIEFAVMSDIAWLVFREMACSRLRLDPTHIHLGYRVYVEGLADVSPKDLISDGDWHNAMQEVGEKFENSSDVELEIVNVNCSHLQTSLEARARGLLSPRAPRIETYAFIYPCISLNMPDGYAGLGPRDIEVLQSTGIHYADDFTFCSPLSLCLSTKIEPEQIVALYFWAGRMISMVHRREKELVTELQAIRREL